MLSTAPKSKHSLSLFIISALSILTLQQVLSVGFLVLDDPFYVTSNLMVQKGFTLESVTWAFSTLYYGNWAPLTWIYHILDVELFALSPAGHHITALLLHTINSCFFYLLLCRFKLSNFVCLVSAIIFALHPLHVEPVAWVSSHKDLLSSFFFFLTLLSYVAYVKGRKTFYTSSILLFFLGLSAKSSLITLPLVLLLLDFWPLERRFNKKLFLEKVPYVVLSVVFVLLTKYAQGILGATSYNFLGFTRRIGNAFYYICSYIYNFLFPFKLSIQYPAPFDSISVVHLTFYFLLVLFLTLFLYFKRNKFQSLFFSWAWFLILLAPYLQIVQVGNQSMSDRWMYLPLAGLAIISAKLIDDCMTKIFKILTAFIVVIFFSASSCAYIEYWKIPGGVFLKSALAHKGNDLAYYYAGLSQEEMGDFQEAKANYFLALRANSNNEFAFEKLAQLLSVRERGQLQEFFKNLDKLEERSVAIAVKRGKILKIIDSDPLLSKLFQEEYRKRPAELAVSYFNKAIDAHPKNQFIHSALGDTYLLLGENDKAEVSYKKAYLYGQNTASVLNAYGAFYLKNSDRAKAYTALKRGILLNPNSIELQSNLAFLYFLEAKDNLAEKHYLYAVELLKAKNEKNVKPYIGLSEVYTRQGRFKEAELILFEADRLSSDSPEVLNALGGLYFIKKDHKGSLRVLERAIANPELFESLSDQLKVSLLFNRSMLLDKLNRREDAVESLQWLLTIDPDNYQALNYLESLTKTVKDQKNGLLEKLKSQ